MTELSLELMRLARDAQRSTDTDARELAESCLGRLGAKQLRELAVRELVGWIEHYRRAAAHEIERQSAEVRRATSQQEFARVVDANRRQRAAELPTHFEEWYADPSILDRQRKKSETGRPTVSLDSSDAARFLGWLGDRREDWYERGCAAAEEAARRGHYKDPWRAHSFRAQFYPHGGREGYYAAERQRRLQQFIDEISQEVRLETTEKLLNTIFALGDGHRVTWGKATIEEHEQRIEMLAKNATGVVETAARHRAAIEMIRAAGARCLADISVADESARAHEPTIAAA